MQTTTKINMEKPNMINDKSLCTLCIHDIFAYNTINCEAENDTINGGIPPPYNAAAFYSKSAYFYRKFFVSICTFWFLLLRKIFLLNYTHMKHICKIRSSLSALSTSIDRYRGARTVGGLRSSYIIIVSCYYFAYFLFFQPQQHISIPGKQRI